MKSNHKTTEHKRGFALLITLVVVSVVLAIGLSLLFVTTRQQMLAVTVNESEKSFQAAQLGLECLRYHRAQPGTSAVLLREGGSWPPSLSCGGSSPLSLPESSSIIVQNGTSNGQWLYNYKYKYNVGNRCIDTSLYIADMRQATADRTFNIVNEGLSTITCRAGTICTAIFSAGYNRPCNQLNSIFTIQREIAIQY